MTTTDWQPTACILCECNCGIEVQLDGRHARADPRRQGAPRVAGLHLQQGAAARPLPERPAPADLAAAPPPRRQLRGDRLGHRDRRGRRAASRGPRRARRRVDLLLRRRRAGQPPRRRLQRRVPRGARLQHRSNALAQEKTGEFWVDAQLYGGHTRGDFEHAEVAVFVGKNPWQSQGFPRARVVLREIAKDPERSMIVIDPVRTETAELADFHLRVRPGTRRLVPRRAAASLVQEDLVDHAFLAEHVTGAEPVLAALRDVPVADYARALRRRRGPHPRAPRAASAGAESVAVFEDLGVQQAPNSTLCSYLDKLLWILTGNFAKPGGAAPALVDRRRCSAPAARAARRSPAPRSSAGSCRAT